MIALSKLLLPWADKNLRKFPWRKTSSPYKIFVAEFLLKRTTAKAVSKVYPIFIKKFPSFISLSKAKVNEVTVVVSTLGYYKRAKEMLRAVRFIENEYRSSFPRDKRSLLEIPFVGEYTSNAILSLAYDRSFPMVDSNVNRIISRVYFGKNYYHNMTSDVKKIAYNILPKNKHRTFNLAMLDLGGIICLPKNPHCDICPLATICKFRKTWRSYEKK